MSKLKNLINQLSDNELKSIHKSLLESDAKKSAELLKHFRENSLNDDEIKRIINVNNNAFYTLRSRLNEKIESFFLQQMESPRTTLLKQVASVNEIVLSKKKTIAIATLKKLEKELANYDLSNELTLVYKALKKLKQHSPDYYEYSQLYNRHVAYMLAVDKVEDMLATYFAKFGNQWMLNDESEKMSLSLIKDELDSTRNLYKSHRLTIYYNCCAIFHRLFVEPFEDQEEAKTYFETTFNEIKEIFETYSLDTIYHNLQYVFRYLEMLYHYKMGNFSKVDKCIDDLNPVSNLLISNYSLYTAPASFLRVKLERYLALGLKEELAEENEKFFDELDIDPNDIPNYTSYMGFRGLACHYSGRYEEGIKWLEELLEVHNLKGQNQTQIDIKLLLSFMYLKMGNEKETISLINNVQRQIRLLDKDNCPHSYLFMKVIKAAIADLTPDKKERKLANYISKFAEQERPFCSPLKNLRVEMEDFAIVMAVS